MCIDPKTSKDLLGQGARLRMRFMYSSLTYASSTFEADAKGHAPTADSVDDAHSSPYASAFAESRNAERKILSCSDALEAFTQTNTLCPNDLASLICDHEKTHELRCATRPFFTQTIVFREAAAPTITHSAPGVELGFWDRPELCLFEDANFFLLIEDAAIGRTGDGILPDLSAPHIRRQLLALTKEQQEAIAEHDAALGRRAANESPVLAEDDDYVRSGAVSTSSRDPQATLSPVGGNDSSKELYGEGDAVSTGSKYPHETLPAETLPHTDLPQAAEALIPRSHQCSACTREFRYAKDLRRHRGDAHSTIRTHFCSIPACKFAKRGFKRKDQLARHMRTVHAAEKTV